MMLIKSWEKMEESKRNQHLQEAENFLTKIHQNR
jgi:hypothetical protein